MNVLFARRHGADSSNQHEQGQINPVTISPKKTTQYVQPNEPEGAPNPGKMPKFCSFTHEAPFEANGRLNTFPQTNPNELLIPAKVPKFSSFTHEAPSEANEPK